MSVSCLPGSAMMVVLFLLLMGLLLRLQFFQYLIQTVKTLIPDLLILLNPLRNFVQFLGLDFTDPFTTALTYFDQPTLDQNFDVFRDGRTTDRKVFGNPIQT